MHSAAKEKNRAGGRGNCGRYLKQALGLCMALLLLLSPLLNIYSFAAENEPADPEAAPEQETLQPQQDPEALPENGEFSVTLHEIDPDGTEIFPQPEDGEADETPLSLSVSENTSLSEWFEASRLQIGTDQTPAQQCKWYTLDENGQKTLYDLQTPVGQDLELYTYYYRLALHYEDEAVQTFSLEDSGAQQTQQVVAREAMPLDESVLEGAESLEWSELQTGAPISLASLQQAGLTENYELRAITPAGSGEATVFCYAVVDGQWKQIAEVSTDQKATWGTKSRYYLTLEDLTQVYAPFGFDPDTYQGQLCFPHTDTASPDTIWADTAPVYDTALQTYRIPLSSRTVSYVFYLPDNTEDSSAFCDTSVSKNDETILSRNNFYEVAVLDPRGLTAGAVLPQTQYLKPGSNVHVTVPMVSGVNWMALNAVTGAQAAATETEDAAAQTVTFTVYNLPHSVHIVASAGFAVCYKASLNGSIVNLSGEYTAGMQEVIKDATVQGSLTFTEAAEDASVYTLRAPDSDVAETAIITSGSNNRKYYYTFQGWKIEGTDVVLAPGEQLTEAQIADYADASGTLTLVSTWEAVDSNNRIETINFFLNLDCEIMDNMSNGFMSQHQSKFTQSVYATRIFDTENVPATTDRYIQLIAPPTKADTAYEVDRQLRKATREAIDPGVLVESFPSDEDILSTLRRDGSSIRLDGELISSEMLTSENFTIRWYVLKYEKSDGWHIDGVLVAKQGRLVIRKSFAGDQEAIAQAKENFAITVTHQESEGGTATQDYLLSLNDKESETRSGVTGYTSYDAQTDTYTWSLIVRQSRDYIVKEQGYLLDQDAWNHTNRYRVVNSDTHTDRWRNYRASGVSVTAVAYPNDVSDTACQTVEFQNLYVRAGLLTVNKIDAATGRGLSGVRFQISLADGRALTLYRKPGTSQYSTDTNAVQEGYTELVEDNRLVTDASGNFYIRLAINGQAATSETYDLQEQVPEGYEGPTRIRITVTDEGVVTMAEEVLESSDANEEWLDGVGTSILTVKNRAKTLSSLTVEKNWGSTPAAETQPVTVVLWRNGAPMQGAAYTQVLSSENGWRYTWQNLPLYVDGQAASYQVRETMIGDAAYDPGAEEDGYSDYVVSYDALRYREGTSGAYHDAAHWTDAAGTVHYADQALLIVHNAPVKGTITFKKVDESGNPLTGAKFTLYADPDCQQALETAPSDAGGFVTFAMRPAGVYYLKETQAPAGYACSDTVYRVTIRGGVATITLPDGDGTPVSRIENHSLLTLILRKENSVGNLLPGAEFKIRKDEAPYGTFTVGADGTLEIPGLTAGLYEIRETKAPSGYARREDVVTICVKNGTMTLQGEDGAQPDAAWRLTGPEEDRYTLHIVNQVLYNLPTMGGRGIYAPMLAGLFLMCAAAAVGALQLRRRRAS